MGAALTDRRPFRAPHHSASMVALVGGGSARQARRNLARSSRRSVPGRTAGVSSPGARQLAAADRDWRDRDRARQPPHRLPCPLPADRGHESVPVRPCRRPWICLRARVERALRRPVSKPSVRPAARPIRPDDRRAPPSLRPTSCGSPRRRARRKWPRASPWRAPSSASVTANSVSITSAATPPRPRASWRRWPRPMLRRRGCCAMRPSADATVSRGATIAAEAGAHARRPRRRSGRCGARILAEALSYRGASRSRRRLESP